MFILQVVFITDFFYKVGIFLTPIKIKYSITEIILGFHLALDVDFFKGFLLLDNFHKN